MRFERLQVPSFKLPFDWLRTVPDRLRADLDRLPDLAAFNRRVHRRIDPWFERNWVRRLTWLGAGGFAFFTAVWLFFASGLPSSETLLAYQPPLPTNVRGYDGNPVQTFARERRVELSYDEYPPVVIEAFLSAEDKTFFSHGGIDYPGLVGAVFDYGRKSVSGGRAKGGSTITQQVAKYLLQDNSYSIGRKIREAILSFRLESTLSKEQILELYLNSIFLGRNAYGVQAASRAYFDKDVGELTLPEAAYLAVLPKAPSNYDPVRATERALARRNYVLREMENNGYITHDERIAAAASGLGTIRYGSNEKFRQSGGYFMEEVRRQLMKQFGEKAEDGPNSVYAGGLWVRSSMVPVMQDAAAEALREGLARFDGGRGWRDTGLSVVNLDGDWRGELDRAAVGTGFPDWRKAVVLEKTGGIARIGFTNGSTGVLAAGNAVMPRRGGGGTAFDNLRPGLIIIVKQIAGDNYAIRSIPEIGGGFVAEEVKTGRVLAMQGGFDVLGSGYNRATQALRQPGSAFKPIVYEAALENGMTPASIVVDAPFCVWQGAGLGNKCFRNFDGKYSGPKTMRWGVEQSRNLMTIRAASQTGMAKVIDTAKKLGVGEYPNYLSIALGAGDTTVLKLTNAYAILANQGRSVRPTTVDYVQDRAGKVIFRSDNRCALMETCNAADWDGRAMPRPPSRTRQVIDPQAAFQMVHILTGVVERGTATVLRDLNRPLFGKTGTTSGPTNVWFVGGTPDIVAGVYIGYDQPRPMGHGAQGGRIAAPIFKQFAQKAFQGMPPVPFVSPAGIRWVRIDRVTGKRAFGTFPTREDPKSSVIWEAFKPETEPRRTYRRSQESDGEAGRAAGAGRAVASRRAAPRPRPQQQPQSDLLQRQGGIY
jgi:penicillin-binding protein 1A